MRTRRLFFIAVLLAGVAPLAAESRELIARVRALAWEKDVAAARQLIEQHRAEQKQLTPEWLAAVSWLARGSGFAKDWDTAEKYATEAFEGSLRLLQQRSLDADSHLPTALGAAIEVLGLVHDARGDRAAALAFLRAQHAAFQGTSIETRLRKNILLLSLEGKPFPGLDARHYIGRKPPAASDLKGKVALFFFWAHWCGDCKRQKPVLEALYNKYGGQGLVIVGPTQLYGYISRGRDASPEEELDYLKNTYRQQHPIPSWMSVPVSSKNFLNFGVSTTPTLVLVGRDGIVRLYHPGNLSYEELAARIEPLLEQPTD